MRNRHSRRASDLLTVCGLAAPFYARFVGEGEAGAGGAEGAGGDPKPDDAGDEPKPDPKPADEVAKLKAEKEAAIAESIRRKDELRKLKEENDKLKKDTPSAQEIEELRQLKAQREKEAEENAKKRGEFERLAAEREAKHREALATLQAAKDQAEARWAKDRVTGELASLIPMHTTVEPKEIMPLIERHVTWNKDEDRFDIDVNGAHPMNTHGKEMTVAEFVEDWIGKRDWLSKHKPAGGSGSAATTGRAAKSGKFTAEDIAKMSYDEYEKNRAAIMAQTGKA